MSVLRRFCPIVTNYDVSIKETCFRYEILLLYSKIDSYHKIVLHIQFQKYAHIEIIIFLRFKIKDSDLVSWDLWKITSGHMIDVALYTKWHGLSIVSTLKFPINSHLKIKDYRFTFSVESKKPFTIHCFLVCTKQKWNNGLYC